VKFLGTMATTIYIPQHNSLIQSSEVLLLFL